MFPPFTNFRCISLEKKILLLTVYLYTSNIFVQVRQLYVFIHNFSHLQPLRCSLEIYGTCLLFLSQIVLRPRILEDLLKVQCPSCLLSLQPCTITVSVLHGLAFFQSRVLSASYPYSYASCPPSTLTVTQPADLIFFSLVPIQPCVLTASYSHCLVSQSDVIFVRCQSLILTASHPQSHVSLVTCQSRILAASYPYSLVSLKSCVLSHGLVSYPRRLVSLQP